MELNFAIPLECALYQIVTCFQKIEYGRVKKCLCSGETCQTLLWPGDEGQHHQQWHVACVFDTRWRKWYFTIWSSFYTIHFLYWYWTYSGNMKAFLTYSWWLPFIIHRCYMSKYFELLSPSWVNFLVKSNDTINLIIDMFGFNSTKIVFSICLSALSYSVHLFLTSLEWIDIFSIPFYLLCWLFSHVSLCYLFCGFPYAFLIYQVYLQK